MRSGIAVEVTAADRDRLHAIVANRNSPQDSHVRHFKQQAQNFFARASSCSVRPLLGMAGGTIIKRRLIML
jgi:hypothetical protein